MMATIGEALRIAAGYLDGGQLDDARLVLERILAVAPDHAATWNLLGVVKTRQGDTDAAVKCFYRAIARDPTVAEYYNNVGSLLGSTGRFGQAEACFLQAHEIDPDFVAAQANLIKLRRHQPLYPMHIPVVRVQGELDFLLVNLPPMNGGEMIPNGLGYVHNALLRSGVRCQTLDLNVIWFQRFCQQRLLLQTPVVTAGGYVLKDSLWSGTEHLEWEREEIWEHFRPEIDALLEQISHQGPKAVGLSVHASNRAFCRRFVAELRRAAPNSLVVVGGYDCAYPEIGPRLFPDFDYMVIFEGDLTVGPLAAAIARGERPKDLPGVLSRYDTPGRVWQPGPLLEDLDDVDSPRYQWAGLHLYGMPGATVPITGSRGCHWGRCRFCAECFPFRRREPRKVVDEMEEWTHRGSDHFHFYESDVNGDPQALDDMCSEIIRRELHLCLSAQIRVDKRNTSEYFQHLRRAGFLHLRFGVDGWTDHVLALQRKGYTMATVRQNLRDCRAAGITTGVNLVVGVPGETDEDVDHTIANLVDCKEHYDTLEFINPLSLGCVSEYYRHAEQYQIRFRRDKEALRDEHPYDVPDEFWYSEQPYIDKQVRRARMERIAEAVRRAGVKLGGWTEWILGELRDPQAYLDGFGEIRHRD